MRRVEARNVKVKITFNYPFLVNFPRGVYGNTTHLAEREEIVVNVGH